MGEIKIRAWHKLRKEMMWFDVTWGGLGGVGAGYIGLLPIGESRSYASFGGDNRIQVEPGNCEFMPCTGFTDKNNRDIYKDDIVKLSFGRYIWMYLVTTCDGFGNNLYFVNRYRNFKTGAEGETIWGDYWVNEGRELRFSDSSEIIGNLHETPEFLDKKELL